MCGLFSGIHDRQTEGPWEHHANPETGTNLQGTVQILGSPAL